MTKKEQVGGKVVLGIMDVLFLGPGGSYVSVHLLHNNLLNCTFVL